MVPIEHLADLQHDVETLREQSFIDQILDETYLQRNYDFTLHEQFPAARSLIIVAAPCQNIQTVFIHNGQRIPVMLPAGYGLEDINRHQVETIIPEILSQEGYELRQARVPEKLLAVRSGLGTYGRNNVCYVPGMGSFHTLAAFYSDLPCETDTWQEAALSEECRTCSICLRQCPTGAIVEDRVLIHAERCLTFFNELPGDFPEWLDPTWHHCLVGCLKCQHVCPQNKKFANTVGEIVEFTGDETDFLLQWQPGEGDIPETLHQKLLKLGLRHYSRVLARNLHAVLDALEYNEVL
jgi:epoxyqueuosine reductase